MSDTFYKQNKKIYKEYPYMENLYIKLLEIVPQSTIVLRYGEKNDVDNLLSNGKIQNLPVENLFSKGRNSHKNSANIYKENSNCKIMTGYSYNELENLWKEHSWVVENDNLILETIADKKDIYYGYELNEEESENFIYSYLDFE